jgi:hypothetical protein
MVFGKRSAGVRRGSKVTAVEPVGTIPEGTTGVVKLIDGFGWIRYWVAWSTGEWTGSVDATAVVASDRYEDYKREQAEAAERTNNAPAAAATAVNGDVASAGGGGGGGDGRVPEHLLERSRQARARKATPSA